MTTPKYEHDCDSCLYLGTECFDNQFFDMYFCPRCDEGSLIARYSSDGPSYTSYPLFVWEPRRLGKITYLTADGGYTHSDVTLAECTPEIECAYQLYLLKIA
jgi:hypothetical protein